MPIALKDYEICYPDPIILENGDIVRIRKSEEESSDWYGWHFVENIDGKQGWVSTSFMSIKNDEGKIIKPYTAKELMAKTGQNFVVKSESHGWFWCSNSLGEEGWLPRNIFEIIPENLTISGNRLTLEPSSSDHYPFLREMLSDLKTMEELQYMAKTKTQGWSLSEVEVREKEWKQLQKEQKCVHFTMIFEGKPVGTCGFNNVSFEHKNAEFGIILHHPYWGKGLALEAHYLCLEYAFEKLDLHRVEFVTFETNSRMRKFFDKFEIKLESIQVDNFIEFGQFKSNATYVVLKPEWPDLKQRLKTGIGPSD